MPTSDGGILFTAFEPSGDALAARLAAELGRREPERPLYALGGPALAEAGAQLLEDTTAHAAMGLSIFAHAAVHRRRLQRLGDWLTKHPLAAVVPVDSPAANWSVCERVRRDQPQARVIHLVCPQVWAWATWRVRRLRRLTDHVLCILPFEPEWLARHRVPATFVGHPLFDQTSHEPLIVGDPAAPRLALLPGSRSAEVHANWPTMIEVFRGLYARHPGLTGRVAAFRADLADAVRHATPDLDRLPLTVEIGQTDDILRTSTAALVVSGTATLHTAARRCPMVVLYRVNRWSWNLLGRWLIRTRTFSLPNLLAESFQCPGRVPEFVPHFGRVDTVAAAVETLVADAMAREKQQTLFARIGEAFEGHSFACESANAVEVLLTSRR